MTLFYYWKNFLLLELKMENLYFQTVRGGRFVPAGLGTAQEALWGWPCLSGLQTVMWRAAARETDEECGWRSHLASSKDDREPLCCLLCQKNAHHQHWDYCWTCQTSQHRAVWSPLTGERRVFNKFLFSQHNPLFCHWSLCSVFSHHLMIFKMSF